MTRRIFLPAVFHLFLALPATAAPPRVVQCVPANHDRDVDPSLQELRITFDQDMDRGGFSLCGGGPKYPRILGNPRWVSPRAIVLRVALEPDHDYAFSVNCPSAQNFRSAAGEPAEIQTIRFRTAAAGARAASQPASAPASQPAVSNAEALRELQRLIDQEYSYRDLRNVDWKQRFSQYGPKLAGARSPAEFADLTAGLLAPARDIHMWLAVDEEGFPIFRRHVRPNADFKQLARRVPGWKKWNRAVYSGRFDDGIGYLLVTTWERSDEVNVLEPALGALREFQDTRGLILDVRPNSGGAEPLAQEVAGCFIDKPAVYSKHVYRAPDARGGFSPPSDRILKPNRKGPRYRGRVAILMGPVNMSSCESFLLMMRQVPGCKLFGEKSYGASGNPKPHDLGNGVTIYVPSWKDMQPDGTCIEGVGVAPDVTVPFPASPADRDPVLDAALKYLRQRR